MSYRNPITGRFASQPEPPLPARPRTWYRVAVELPGRVRPRGLWRTHYDHAMQDAIDMGLTAFDRSAREHYLAVPASIQTWSSVDRPADDPDVLGAAAAA